MIYATSRKYLRYTKSVSNFSVEEEVLFGASTRLIHVKQWFDKEFIYVENK
jgi:hypothetical protein